jgi:hypothetical protein
MDLGHVVTRGQPSHIGLNAGPFRRAEFSERPHDDEEFFLGCVEEALEHGRRREMPLTKQLCQQLMETGGVGGLIIQVRGMQHGSVPR